MLIKSRRKYAIFQYYVDIVQCQRREIKIRDHWSRIPNYLSLEVGSLDVSPYYIQTLKHEAGVVHAEPKRM